MVCAVLFLQFRHAVAETENDDGRVGVVMARWKQRRSEGNGAL